MLFSRFCRCLLISLILVGVPVAAHALEAGEKNSDRPDRELILEQLSQL